MSDWQKVLITFNDADGSEVSAVMWKHKRDECEVFSHTETSGPDLWIEWNRDYESLTVEPIRELPTGVGAVIRCIGTFRMGDPSDDVYTLSVDGKWHNGYDAKTPDQMTHWEYEILSEGFQIGDVK